MGTRSSTVFFTPDGQVICVMYRSADGKLTEHGADLREWAGSRKICAGIGDRDIKERNWNGMGDLAADCIAHFREKLGLEVYVCTPRHLQFMTYRLSAPRPTIQEPALIQLQVNQGDRIIYSGLMSEFDPIALSRRQE